MGQAALDLPDPLQEPPVSSASTDDLLAQLAGEEIDRLMADDHAGGLAAPAAPVPPPSTSAPATTAQVQPADTLSNQLNELLGEPTDAPAETSGKSAGASQPPPAEEAATTSQERGLLDIPTSDASVPPTAPLRRSETRDNPFQLVVRPLVWLSAPLEACPEPMRDAIGKIAILTTLNAVAVLTYVLFFRHR